MKAFQTLSTSLKSVFPERANVVDGAIAAVLAGEHVLILGPPGTAKSLLVRVLAQSLGCSYFERLLTKFSTPDELFGPISLTGLEQDRFYRVTGGMLPDAEIAFIDEIFKANSAILNSILSIVNERIMHNDGKAQSCPLITLFGASNELPEGKELEALYDRFLLRFDVNYLLQSSSLKAMLLAPEPAISSPLTKAELIQAMEQVKKIHVSEETVEALIAVREACRAEGIIASDRRWKKSLKLAQASAFLAGEVSTSPEDLTPLADSLWNEPKDRPKVAALVGRMCDPVSAQATEILDAAKELLQKVQSRRGGDRQQYVKEAAQALDAFNAQTDSLNSLAKGKSRRAGAVIKDSLDEINSMHRELSKIVTAGLRLKR